MYSPCVAPVNIALGGGNVEAWTDTIGTIYEHQLPVSASVELSSLFSRFICFRYR